jgi:hypothetical protein
MASVDSNARWRDLAAIREEIDDQSAVVVPICVSRLDGRRHELSPKARRFAEALSFTDGWSGISDARHRRAA